MMRIAAVGRSDVGRSRQGKANEDAYHVGDSAFAVADGMGGHLAGEVASALALEPLANLDGRVYADANEALKALRDAVAAANARVVERAGSDMQLRGMGTTLTAVMVEGRRAHIAHVGDSRAYLLRDGGFSQLTTDHTLVQRLVDEGRITSEEAAHHPQRSVITRAIGVEDQVDVDAMTLELADGDRLLLCSDGLSGPVTDEAMARILAQDDIDRIPDDLIDAANDAGGPDNITAVVIGFELLDEDGNPDRAPGPRPVQVTTTSRHAAGDDGDDWADRLGHIGNLSPDHPGGAPQPTQRSWTPVVALVLVAALLGGGFVFGRSLLQRSWYVGVADDGVVTIYRGLPVELGPLALSWPHEATTWHIDDVPLLVRDNVIDGLPVSDLDDAQLVVDNWEGLGADDEDATPSSATTAPDPATSPSPSAGPS
jgi:serine/threonine protein phosphatase PrpC